MHNLQFYIGGQWVDPVERQVAPLVNPATEEPFAEVALGTARDVDHAVQAARRAFPAFARTSVADRLALLERIVSAFEARREELAQVITREMGAPISFSLNAQVASGPNHLKEMIRVLGVFDFAERRGTTLIAKEPIGVCGLITPWNWPINQIVSKVAPALAAGCTVVLKPSEISPLSGIIFAEILHAAGVPPGVFNLVNGDGARVGQAIAAHPDIDMVSFTGSTRAGVMVAAAAAASVKRVAQELGGKSPNILLPDVDLARAVAPGVARCFGNAGQSCSAATRMLVPSGRQSEAVALARKAAEEVRPGDPQDPRTTMGPLVSRAQFDKVQDLIASGIAEGATLVVGGLGRPEGLGKGYFVRPTIFADVRPDMRIAREEIFGPVLSIMPYETVDQAVAIANDTEYGLTAYVQGADLDLARQVARQIRAGSVHINYPPLDRGAPFGGYKRSGNGREWGEFGLNEYLELKAIVGYDAA
jgi:aldehyde dehydrogenase (NAD+)